MIHEQEPVFRAYCKTPQVSCVEAAEVGDKVMLRDGKNPNGGVLENLTPEEITAFCVGWLETHA